MKGFKMILGVAIALILVSSVAMAGDFDWIRDFNIRAEADAAGFRAQLATRFRIGDARISAILGNAGKPADAYIALRLGEMAKRPPEDVLKEYKTGKAKGWGAIAKGLGIKPGSKEFRALKRGHDLDLGKGQKPGKNKGNKGVKGKTKGKGKKNDKKKDTKKGRDKDNDHDKLKGRGKG
jgi:hypothetical protein